MGHSDVFGHLAFERVYVRTERCDPIASEGIFYQFKLFAAHVRRREVDAWQHRFIHFEQLESRPVLPCPARERSMRQVPYPAQQGSDTQEKTKPKWPAGRISNSSDPSAMTIGYRPAVPRSSARSRTYGVAARNALRNEIIRQDS